MKKNNIVINTFALFFLISCTSMSRNTKKHISCSEIQSLPLSSFMSEVEKSLGHPDENAVDKETNNLIWRFNDTNGDQLVSVTFDHLTHKLIYKYFMPSDADPEIKSYFVFHDLFGSSKFEKFEFQTCGKDFRLEESLYADVKNGLVVVVKHDSNEVVGIGWTTPELVQNQIDEMKNCRR